MTTEIPSKPARTRLLSLIPRHRPDCENDFLRFQFGIEVHRPLLAPVYRKHVVVDHTETDTLVPVFLLLGFGSSESIARDAALAAASRLNLVHIP